MTEKSSKVIVRAIAIVEILIGLAISLSFIIASLITPPGRPKTVYGFVVLTSLISITIGIGLFKYRNWGRRILIFFAGYVIVTKFLLFSNLVAFTGNTIKFVSLNIKDVSSFFYHCGMLILFNLKDIKKVLH